MIEFLQESRMCIINGRRIETLDDFTSTSIKGSAVVDYILVPIEEITKFSNFDVKTCLTVIDELNLQALTGDKSKPLTIHWYHASS